MSHPRIQRALISVYDKTGLLEFARALVTEFGVEILSTGGTAKHLKEGGVPVTLVEEVTGLPEMLDGRVKTLHPKIHAAILADRDNPEHMRQLEEQGIKPIDMVVVNLYPFEKTVADPKCTLGRAIEMIDIGGPCLLRAAAKNCKHVIPLIRSASLPQVLEELRRNGQVLLPMRLRLASMVFKEVSNYDARIDDYFTRERARLAHGESELDFDGECRVLSFHFLRKSVCRYGENPHQHGELLQGVSAITEASLLSGFERDGPEVSYNNFADAHAALELCKELARAGSTGNLLASGERKEPICVPYCCVFIKHTNPCGAATAADPIEAYSKAYLADPNAAMGGVLACSFAIDCNFAEVVMNTFARWGKQAGAGGFFVEVWVALSFEPDAIERIRSSKEWGKRVRLFSAGDMNQPPNWDERECKSITGGMLVQTRDLVGLNEDQWKVVTQRRPSELELADLRLAWLIAKHTKSNAISICKGGMLIGNGAGQMSRVMSCRIATWLASEKGHADKLKGAVAASDAFFPFDDGPSILMEAGVTAIIQPGGSKNDDKVIAACDRQGAAMVFTGTRHFKH